MEREHEEEDEASPVDVILFKIRSNRWDRPSSIRFRDLSFRDLLPRKMAHVIPRGEHVCIIIEFSIRRLFRADSFLGRGIRIFRDEIIMFESIFDSKPNKW